MRPPSADDQSSIQSAQVELAVEAARNGSYEQAISTLQTLAEQDSTGRALYLLARTQYEAGDSATSLGSLDRYLRQFSDAPGAPRASLLRAEVRAAAGDLAAAALDFAEYSSTGGPAASYALMRLGDIARTSGDTAAAINYYTRSLGQGLSSYSESQVMLILSELHESAGQPDQAGYWAERVAASTPSTRDRIRALDRLAALNLRTGHREAWIELSSQIITKFPGASVAAETLESLLAEGLPVSLTDQAAVHLAQGDFSAAELLLLQATTHGPGEASAAAFQLGLLRELAGDPQGALNWFRQSHPDPSASYASRLELHTLENALLTGEEWAASALERFASEQRGTVLAVSATQAIARWHESHSRTSDAAHVWLTASRLALEADDLDRAVENARHAASLFAQSGEHDAARSSLATAASADPGSFLTIRAEAELNGDDLPRFYVERPVDEWLASFTASSLTRAAERITAAERTALELQLAGLASVSGAESAESTAVARHRPAFLVGLARNSAAEGQAAAGARAAGSLMANLPVELRRDIPAEVGRLAYPRPYLEIAEQEAASVGLDPLLLYALIRQESFFDPRAHSSADARGLTQVIPSTAESIARTLGVDGFSNEQLYQPPLSLAFGAYYLDAQLEAFDGHVLAALAAYNGGPGNARRWGQGGGFQDPDLYLQQIDFRETHNYVQRVLEHYAHYRALYLEESRPNLPGWAN